MGPDIEIDEVSGEVLVPVLMPRLPTLRSLVWSLDIPGLLTLWTPGSLGSPETVIGDHVDVLCMVLTVVAEDRLAVDPDGGGDAGDEPIDLSGFE